MTDELTPGQVIGEMPNYFQREKAGSTKGNVQFDLSGDNGGKWWIRIADGTAESGQGELESPNLTLLADAGDYVKIATGKLDPTAAFMSGKLKIKGDMGLAMKFASLFRRPDAQG
jgi:putative sterol carrier protein